MRAPGGKYAVARADDFAHGISADDAAARIFDRIDASADIRLHAAVFKGEVAVFRGAVDEFQVFTIAKRLGALDMAADERKSLRIPAEVFPVDLRINDRNVLRVPEGVLRVEYGAGNAHVFRVLKGVFARKAQPVGADAAALEKAYSFRRSCLCFYYPCNAKPIPAKAASYFLTLCPCTRSSALCALMQV